MDQGEEFQIYLVAKNFLFNRGNQKKHTERVKITIGCQVTISEIIEFVINEYLRQQTLIQVFEDEDLKQQISEEEVVGNITMQQNRLYLKKIESYQEIQVMNKKVRIDVVIKKSFTIFAQIEDNTTVGDILKKTEIQKIIGDHDLKFRLLDYKDETITETFTQKLSQIIDPRNNYELSIDLIDKESIPLSKTQKFPEIHVKPFVYLSVNLNQDIITQRKVEFGTSIEEILKELEEQPQWKQISQQAIKVKLQQQSKIICEDKNFVFQGPEITNKETYILVIQTQEQEKKRANIKLTSLGFKWKKNNSKELLVSVEPGVSVKGLINYLITSLHEDNLVALLDSKGTHCDQDKTIKNIQQENNSTLFFEKSQQGDLKVLEFKAENFKWSNGKEKIKIKIMSSITPLNLNKYLNSQQMIDFDIKFYLDNKKQNYLESNQQLNLQIKDATRLYCFK